MAKPGFLSLGVLPCTDGDGLGDGVASALAMQVLHGLLDTDTVEPRRVRGVSLGKHRRHLFDESALDHFRGPALDALVQDGPGHTQHHIPRVERALLAGCSLPVRQRVPGQHGDFDAAHRALPPPTAVCRVKSTGPAHQLPQRELLQLRLQGQPLPGIEGRLAEETLH